MTLVDETTGYVAPPADAVLKDTEDDDEEDDDEEDEDFDPDEDEDEDEDDEEEGVHPKIYVL